MLRRRRIRLRIKVEMKKAVKPKRMKLQMMKSPQTIYPNLNLSMMDQQVTLEDRSGKTVTAAVPTIAS